VRTITFVICSFLIAKHRPARQQKSKDAKRNFCLAVITLPTDGADVSKKRAATALLDNFSHFLRSEALCRQSIVRDGLAVRCPSDGAQRFTH